MYAFPRWNLNALLTSPWTRKGADEERTSAGTSSESDATTPTSTVISEVVAKQVVNLARCGEGQALLASQGQDRDARDRLVVFLEPSSAEEEGLKRDENGRQNARSGDNLASKYALVVPSAPGQVRGNLVTDHSFNPELRSAMWLDPSGDCPLCEQGGPSTIEEAYTGPHAYRCFPFSRVFPSCCYGSRG